MKRLATLLAQMTPEQRAVYEREVRAPGVKDKDKLRIAERIVYNKPTPKEHTP